jgi:hypothetical protein
MVSLLVGLVFWVTILWFAFTLVKTLQRIAGSLEEIARQNKDRLMN